MSPRNTSYVDKSLQLHNVEATFTQRMQKQSAGVRVSYLPYLPNRTFSDAGLWLVSSWLLIIPHCSCREPGQFHLPHQLNWWIPTSIGEAHHPGEEPVAVIGPFSRPEQQLTKRVIRLYQIVLRIDWVRVLSPLTI